MRAAMTRWAMRCGCAAFVAIVGMCVPAHAEDPAARPEGGPAGTVPTVQEMIAAPTDVWGEAAMRRPDGASYEFFKDLLPPLRYADTEFRHYPIVLSAPLAAQKARLISNGSAINARANKKPMWREVGVPVTFSVGEPVEVFGSDIERLDGPRYVDGYLPIVRMTYRHAGRAYEEEVFAPVEPPFAQCGAVFLRFAVSGDSSGPVTARIAAEGALEAREGTIRDEKGSILLAFDGRWRWDAAGRSLQARFEGTDSAVLAVYTKPASQPVEPLTPAAYDVHRRACANAWNDLLARGVRLETPEPIVNSAWRSMIIGNYMIAVGDRMHYSAGNAYDHLYEGECGDATRSLLLFGFFEDARKMVGPLLDFQRQATRFHVCGHKLQLLSYYYWITRDADYMKEKEAVWKGVIDFILKNREPLTGLMPKDRYAGDIAEQVYSTNSSANSWCGLRNIAAVMDELGEKDEAKRLLGTAAEFRKAILAAVEKSECRDTKPPFIPMALLADEKPYDPLCATRKGSYYDLIAPYVIGSGVFGYGSQREDWLIGYLQQHGGIAMGMIRCEPHQGQFNGQPGVNVLYGLRYILALLRRDDRERALVGFYGQLAQGMTRDTFIGGEGSRFVHGDKYGRSFYLPPNSASNAMFLITLRYLLVQDWDLNDDGKPDTLRLLYGVPRRWLKDGATFQVVRAPTMFGEVSMEVASRLGAGEVTVRMVAPPRAPERMFLRLPLPSGFAVKGAAVNGEAVPLVSDGAVDLTGRRGALTIRFTVTPSEGGRR
jgi:hypothetical protein